MKTLIIENDTYLAQSISNKLIDKGYECVVYKDIDFELDNGVFFDVVLISYDVCTNNCINFIKLFPNSITIMMIKYITDDTVTQMLKAGAYDYILKPFVIDELIRKIEHYKDYKRLQQEVVFYKDYFEFIEGILNTPIPFTYSLPLLIRSNSQRSADIYAMRYARLKNIRFNFVNIKNINLSDILNINNKADEIVYLTGLEQLKKAYRNELLSKLSKQNILLSFISKEDIEFNNVANISTPSNDIDLNEEILSIKDYEKAMILKYENIYSDIELAKKLGISRKSLWEKRKRYGITKKKSMNQK
ncbi:MAG: response regulator [Helicobacteraceae bacterium]|nr:response regulator [Helicobacteraceae bacterium]